MVHARCRGLEDQLRRAYEEAIEQRDASKQRRADNRVQRAEVETWVKEHKREEVARFGSLILFRDRIVNMHRSLDDLTSATSPHEVYPLTGLRAAFDREGGQTYSRGSLTRSAIVGGWDKTEKTPDKMFVRIEGPNVFVSIDAGSKMLHGAAKRFVTTFNSTAAAFGPAVEAPAPSGDDVVTKLRELSELHKAGAIDDDEFRALKARLIG